MKKRVKILLITMFVVVSAFFVGAEDIIFEDGSLNITENFFVDTNTLYVDATNNRVGIGTSNPSDLLDVNSKLLVQSTGNVGIGTTTPSGKLNIETANASDAPNAVADDFIIESNTDAGISILTPAGTNKFIIFGNESDNAAGQITYREDSSPHSMRFLVGNAIERMRITDTGNVGIGETSPNEKLHVQGKILSEAGAGEAIRFTESGLPTTYFHSINGSYSSGAAADNKLTFYIGDSTSTGQATVLTLVGDGNVGIGTTAPNSTLTIVAGGTTLASSWDVYSDPTIKANLAEQSINNFDFSTVKLYSYNLKWSETDPIYDENGILISENTVEKTSDRTQLGLASNEVPSECVRSVGDYDAVDTYCLLSLAYVKIAQLETRLVALGG